MGATTGIEWTDATWNPIRGCTRASEGCGSARGGGCYAEVMAARFSEPGQWGHGFAERRNGKGRWTGRVELIESQLLLPLRWKKQLRIFVNSTSDLFHERLPDEAIDRVFAVMALCPQHRFQVLTKRAERMRQYVDGMWSRREDLGDLMGAIGGLNRAGWYAPESDGQRGWAGMHTPLPNVHLGVSVEDQATADERIPHLLHTPAAVRFLSAEPLLRPIDLTSIRGFFGATREYAVDRSSCRERIDSLRGKDRREHLRKDGTWNHRRLDDPDGDPVFTGNCHPRLDWIIVGGESGPGARPMHPDWARSIRDQCASADVPFFFKQWGAWAPCETDDIPERFGDPALDDFRCVSNCGFVGTMSISSAFAHKPRSYPDCFPNGEDGDAICNPTNMHRVGKKAAGRLLDGVEHNGFPEGWT